MAMAAPPDSPYALAMKDLPVEVIDALNELPEERPDELWPPPCWPGHFSKKSLLQLRDGSGISAQQPPYNFSVRYDLRPIAKQMGEKSAYLMLLDGETLRRIGRGSGIDTIAASRSWLARNALCSPPLLLARNCRGRLSGERIVQPEPHIYSNSEGVLLMLVVLTTDIKNHQQWEAACDLVHVRLSSPPIPCGLCGIAIPMRELAAHQEQGCPNVFTECPKCLAQVPLRDLVEHQRGNTAIECVSMCSAEMQTDEKEAQDRGTQCFVPQQVGAGVQTEFQFSAPENLRAEDPVPSLFPSAAIRWSAPSEGRGLCTEYRLTIMEFCGDEKDNHSQWSHVRVELLEVARLEQRCPVRGELRHVLEHLRPEAKYRLELQAQAPDGTLSPAAMVVLSTLSRLQGLESLPDDTKAGIEAEVVAPHQPTFQQFKDELIQMRAEALSLRDQSTQDGPGLKHRAGMDDVTRDVECQAFPTKLEDAACQADPEVIIYKDKAVGNNFPLIASTAVQCGFETTESSMQCEVRTADSTCQASYPPRSDTCHLLAEMELDAMASIHGSGEILRQTGASNLLHMLLVLLANTLALIGIILADLLPETMWPMLASVILLVLLNGLELAFFEIFPSSARVASKLRAWRKQHGHLNRSIWAAALWIGPDALNLFRAAIQPYGHRYSGINQQEQEKGGFGKSGTVAGDAEAGTRQARELRMEGKHSAAPPQAPPRSARTGDPTAQDAVPPPPIATQRYVSAAKSYKPAPGGGFEMRTTGIVPGAGVQVSALQLASQRSLAALPNQDVNELRMALADAVSEDLAGAKCPVCNHVTPIPDLQDLWRSTRFGLYCIAPQLGISVLLLARQVEANISDTADTLRIIVHGCAALAHFILLLWVAARWTQYWLRRSARKATVSSIKAEVEPDGQLVRLSWRGFESSLCDAWVVSLRSFDKKEEDNLRVWMLEGTMGSAMKWAHGKSLKLDQPPAGHHWVTVQPWLRNGGLSMPVAVGHLNIPTDKDRAAEATVTAARNAKAALTPVGSWPLPPGWMDKFRGELPEFADAATDAKPWEVVDASTDPKDPVKPVCDAGVQNVAVGMDAQVQFPAVRVETRDAETNPEVVKVSEQLTAKIGTELNCFDLPVAIHAVEQPDAEVAADPEIAKGLWLSWAPHGLMEAAPRLIAHARRMGIDGQPLADEPSEHGARVVADMSLNQAFFQRLEAGRYELLLSCELGACTAEVVKCPHDRCTHHCWAQHLEEHRMQCIWHPQLCPNAGVGCEWQGCFDEIEDHLLECEHRLVPCRNSAYGCAERMKWCDEPEHVQNCEVQRVIDVAEQVELILSEPCPDYRNPDVVQGVAVLTSYSMYVRVGPGDSQWVPWTAPGHCVNCDKPVDRKDKGLQSQDREHWICWSCMSRQIKWDELRENEAEVAGINAGK
eukprot:TRINITY_DN110184_c0_g1_i1.p1 TRINITY_DN110184_c0_g1~~TRINITY_DN110184_c0_g1_i1.p1  ORF type:complete len:1429 (+),score=247.14 TRINITY_DN110184_c0_g1_i1:40-4287(+)